jgi:hypothetical protein
MKVRLSFAGALIGAALAASASLAEERAAAPAHPADNDAIVSPAAQTGDHPLTAPGGPNQGAPAPQDTGQKSDDGARGKGVSTSVTPDTKAGPEPRPSGPNPNHPSSQPAAQDTGGRRENTDPSDPIDTRITVNQGRRPKNNRAGVFGRRQGLSGTASPPNAPKSIPHSVSRPNNFGPVRNAIGVARSDPKTTAKLGAPPPGPSGAGATTAIGAAKGSAPGLGARVPAVSSTGGLSKPVPGAGGPPSRPGAALAAPARAARVNGTGMGHAPVNAGGIGGAANNNAGTINGTNVGRARP